MANLAGDAIDWWASQMQDHLATSITYSRSANTVTLNATVGTTDYEVVVDGSISVVAQTRDYLVQATDLIIAGQQIQPKRGDQIQESGSGDVYEVLSVGPGNHFFRYADPEHKVMRIHTKLAK